MLNLSKYLRLASLPLLGKGCLLVGWIGALLLLSSCIHEEVPTSSVSDEQVSHMSNTQLSMLYGISSYMVTYNSWGVSGYYMNDWGYPCQMYFREVCGEDFPVYKSTYDYWTYHENGTYASSYTIYTWYFYYRLIRNCNNLIGAIRAGQTTNDDSRHYLGAALAFRALAYMDLSRLFEFRPTGYSVDAKATEVLGLTVPIVTEKTTEAEQINNPRAERDSMHAFILADLLEAESLLCGYDFDDKSLPGLHVVQGLLARYWLEVATRSDRAADWTAARDYAYLAMAGYTPMTESEWHNSISGFNTANSAWMWRCRIGGKEQQPAYYCTYPGQIASEPVAGLCRAYNAYRCIGSDLYAKIKPRDWRRYTWIDPADAGIASDSLCRHYQTLLDTTAYAALPPYANLKFRPGEGNLTDAQIWINGDLPLMRVEEMYFIAAEAEAHISGHTAGFQILKDLISTRFTDGNYKVSVTVRNMDTFLKELMLQKRIEFWGEGILFFDYKRLGLVIDRTLSSNYESDFQLRSLDGYAAPWMNFYIPTQETQRNTACLPNPDVSDQTGEYK